MVLSEARLELLPARILQPRPAFDGSGGIAATDDYATGRAGTPLKSGGTGPIFSDQNTRIHWR
jgi:hypothetical protein